MASSLSRVWLRALFKRLSENYDLGGKRRFEFEGGAAIMGAKAKDKER
jgi:hypothetical protein